MDTQAVITEYVARFENEVGDEYAEHHETIEATSEGTIVVTQHDWMSDGETVTVTHRAEGVITFDSVTKELARIDAAFAEDFTIATILFAVTAQIAA